MLGAFDQDPHRAAAWSKEATAANYSVFAPIVLRHATQGDPIGWRIAERAAEALGDLLDMFLARGIDRLSLVGGVSDAIGAWLTPALRGRLKAPDADAIAGALMLARRRFGLPGRQAEGEPTSEFRV